MPDRQATSIGQRSEMMRLVEEGRTYAEVAEQVGVSYWTARKWIRRGKRGGLENLASSYGRPALGPLGGFDPLVRYIVLRLKKEHPKWGAEYVVKKLKEKPSLKGKEIPGGTTIWRYWRSFGDRLMMKCQFAHVNVPGNFGNDVPPDFTQNAPPDFGQDVPSWNFQKLL